MAEEKSSGSGWVVPVIIVVVILLIVTGVIYVVFHPIFSAGSTINNAIKAVGGGTIVDHPQNASQKIANTAVAVTDAAGAVNAAAGAIGNVVSLGESISNAFGGGSSGDTDDPSGYDGSGEDEFNLNKFENVDGTYYFDPVKFWKKHKKGPAQ